MECKWCEDDGSLGCCFEHCSESVDGVHVHDPQSYQQTSCDNVVDVTCKLCGQSGSCVIDPKDIQWD